MCGIMGFAGNIPDESGVSVVLNGLKKLEYRGYDSSGIAYFDSEDGTIKYIKKSGKLINLFTEIAEIQCKNKLLTDNAADKNKNIQSSEGKSAIIQSSLAIGHIRWATHGKPTDENAHPHLDCSGEIAIVHNGIIENYIQLKEKLLKNNHKFKTETDSEIIAHLIEDHILKGDSFSESVRKTSLELKGSFAIAILYAKEKTIAAVKFGPPLVLAKKGKNLFIASDVSALLGYSNEVIYLKNGEIAYFHYEDNDNNNINNINDINKINNANSTNNINNTNKINNANSTSKLNNINSLLYNSNKLEIINFRGKKQKIDINLINWDASKTVKSGFSHFMQKEIFEQPTTILEGFNSRVLFKKDLHRLSDSDGSSGKKGLSGSSFNKLSSSASASSRDTSINSDNRLSSSASVQNRDVLINSGLLTSDSQKSDALKDLYNSENVKIALEGLKLTKKDIVSAGRIIFIACGSSYYASLVIKNVIENLCGLPVIVDYGSEFRYGKFPVLESDIVVGVSQSGETADTNSAIEIVKEKKAKIISICNVPGSQLTALSNKGVIYTHAGPEIGVASTKAFTSQVLCGILLALYLRQEIMNAGVYINGNVNLNVNGGKSSKNYSSSGTGISYHPGDNAAGISDKFFSDLIALPQKIEEILALNESIKNIANKYYKSTNFLYLGRGILYPIALEGALKLKEISYIHAEGYPSGEMKHGPIALIDENMPVMFLLSNNLLAPKTISNIEEIKARGGRVIALADYDPNIDGLSDLIKIPDTSEILSPILFTVPLQLFAYHIASFKGTDIDQPRNLAKSVTVE